MKKIIISCAILALSFSAMAHRTEVDILETAAAKSVVLAKIGGETGKHTGIPQGLALLDQALAEANKVKNISHREAALAEIANEYAGLNSIDKALEITRGIGNVHLHVTNLGKIANKLVNTNPALATQLLDEAVAAARAGNTPHNLPAELAELSGKYVRLKQTATAQALLADANILVEKLADIHLDHKLSIYAEIAANMVAAGQKEAAFVLFEKAYQQSAALTDPFEKAAILAMLGGELAEKGQPEKAIAMLDEAMKASKLITDENLRSDVASEIAQNYSQAKKCETAAAIGNNITDGYFSCEAYIRTAKNYIKQKQNDMAYPLLTLTRQKAAAIPLQSKKAMMLAKTASELYEMGKGEEAKALLAEALATIG